MTVTADTNQHYDLDPDIFGQFLDPLRKYSSALYESDGDTLEVAQRNKLRFVADRLGLRGGEQLMDVGCGWGALILFMAEEFGGDTLGISPAPRQHEYIAEQASVRGVADRVRTRVGHFERLELPARSVDAVSMLGSIVHMPDLDEVFRRARAVLRRGGTLYVSESCFRNAAAHRAFDERAGTEFVRADIFGWGDLRPLSDLVTAAEDAGFSIISVDDLTEHYRRTIDDWIANVDAAADRIDVHRTGLAATLRHYLEIANAGWGYTTKHYALVCRNAR
ncbi:class I SAM-dependent methyltransferase [Nocardia otitidiscaviarum]|uniref:Class I SAM-dependent methyltransferase n=1 Tax=Nocardia otitidiscaviarum TaxID=1823 RepID=A0A516NHX0_9NOCA|nr:class I SAM-dependent methyltransferase [Nocardia otitidiscaviarum]MCP9618710.1 class I SAM-dependent methyltransferase [Nocardia otitidiscaviarum]QDP78495.1 class I SAM-dependent methyltransferase [Nocardia otitidiscaviarum]